MKKTDFLIIGGGVIGISIARRLKVLFSDASVCVLEKETETGTHASGRNSGVLHAGFYYTPDSLKAQLTKQGNQEMHEYCFSKDIPLNRCGKLVVAKDEYDLNGLDVLLERGRKNGIQLQEISAEEARSIEPRVKTFERAIFSPTTSSVNPTTVMQSMTKDAIDEGVKVCKGVRFIKREENGDILTSDGKFQAGYVVNTAGLYADRVAHQFGFSKHYRILPFKGLYLYSEESTDAIRTNIYPVPDLRNPFLGVHFTAASDGTIKIGPTAIPVFWRENYHGMDNFNFGEFADVLVRQMGLLWSSDFDFKRLAWEEIQKHSQKHMVGLAQALASDIHVNNYGHWGKPGIRAQLLDIRTRKLEMDFVIEGDQKSMHVLNAVSPAFTCSLPFSRKVCQCIQDKINGI